MRLWSIHPKYLDTKGLLALWRESLLAKKVLQNKTKGYKNHPQLIRFKKHKSPILAINNYLTHIYKEAIKRKYAFDNTKFQYAKSVQRIPVTSSQIKFEFDHLLNKLKLRNIKKYNQIKNTKSIQINPIFYKVKGDIESWEKNNNIPPLFNKYLQELKKLNLKVGQYAISGSAPLAIRNIRDIHDLDIIVKKNTYKKLLKKYKKNIQLNGYIKIGNIEIGNTWLGSSENINEMIDNADIIKKLPFVKLKYLIDWKTKLNRKKDIKDIQLIKKYLKDNNIKI